MISNLIVKNHFLNLNPIQRDTLYKELSSEQRKTLVKVIKGNSTNLDQNKMISLEKIISKVESEQPKLTRSKDKSYHLISLPKNVKIFFENLADKIGILTASKTNRVIHKIIVNETLKHDNKPRVKQKELDNLLIQAKTQNIPLKQLLEKNGLSTELVGVKFKTIDENHAGINLKGVNLDGLTFNNCDLYWPSFTGSTLKDVTFKNCSVGNVSFMNSKLENCQFINCDMKEVMFTGATLEGVHFSNSDLICNSFEDAKLNDCLFFKCVTRGTHFLQANVTSSALFECDLKDTVFFDTLNNFMIDDRSEKTATITKPVTTLLVNPENRGISTPKAFMKLDQSSNCIPIRITLQAQTVTKEHVNQNVEDILKNIKDNNQEPPIPQRLIQTVLEKPQAYPDAKRILEKAEKLSTVVDSFFLPGGEDVPPALYGAEVDKKTQWGGDYRRSMLELGIIHYAANKGIPLMGVCRGFQMSNVYFGAGLAQHVEGQTDKVQKFRLNADAKTGLLNTALKNTFIGAVAHHQAIVKGQGEATSHLEGILTYDGLVKAAQPKSGGASPMILLQFHPEFLKAPTADSKLRYWADFLADILLSPTNETMWKIFADSSQAYREKVSLLKEIEERPISPDLNEIKQTDENRERISETNKNIYFARKEKVLAEILKTPKSIRKYFSSLEDPTHIAYSDITYSDKREALEEALRHDDQFLEALIKTNKHKEVQFYLNTVDAELAQVFKTRWKNHIKHLAP